MVSILRFSSRFYIFTGLMGAIVVGAGEHLLHYSPLGPKGEIEMLLQIPLGRAQVGHFLSVFGIPLYFAGYYGLLKLLKSSHELYAKCLFIFGTLSFTYGGVWISSRYYAAVVLQKTVDTPLYTYFFTSYEQNYQVLVLILRFLVFLVSVFYVLSILNNKCNLPKWLAIFNPIVLLGLCFSTLFLFKPLGAHIAPIAMNVTHFVFFGLILYFSRKQAAKKIL